MHQSGTISWRVTAYHCFAIAHDSLTQICLGLQQTSYTNLPLSLIELKHLRALNGFALRKNYLCFPIESANSLMDANFMLPQLFIVYNQIANWMNRLRCYSQI